MDRASKRINNTIIRGILLGISLAGALTASIIIAINVANISFFAIVGDSMNPTFSDKDTLVLKEQAILSNNEIIIFEKPRGWDPNAADATTEKDILVKRLVAAPGDNFSYRDRVFYVNGEKIFVLPKSYPCQADNFEKRLTDSEFIAFGDNASRSTDSRRIFCDGTEEFIIDTDNIVTHGRILFKF